MKKRSISSGDEMFNSRLSFKPLVNALKRSIENGKPGAAGLYSSLIAELSENPTLLQPITDQKILTDHKELIDKLLATVFPASLSEVDGLYAVGKPFRNDIIYASSSFRKKFMKPGGNEVLIPNQEIQDNLQREKLHFAYNLILKKYLNEPMPGPAISIQSFNDANELEKHHAVNIDASFIEVFHQSPDWQMPSNIICTKTNQVMNLEELMVHLPLDQFNFEGLSVIRIEDITVSHAITEIKNALLHVNAFADAEMYEKLESQIRSLLNLKNIRIGLTPFFKVNGHYVFSELHNSNSLLFKQFHSLQEKNEINECCLSLFHESDRPIVFETLNDAEINQIKYLGLYAEQGVKSLILCPLRYENELLGVLEIVTEEPGLLNHTHIGLLRKAIPLFSVALKKSSVHLDSQIDKVIKKQFTAVQPAVEWKFTEAALNYIVNKKKNEETKIERIAFNDVYPLFGSIDIRNSSVQRAHAIQLDLIEQLHMAQDIIKKAQRIIHFPLLMEIDFKIDKYIISATDSLLSDEEIQIHEFLQNQVVSVLTHLKDTVPALRSDIDKYENALDKNLNMIYMHRKDFDESIARINHTVSSYIDKEQASAQQTFSHYFERYITDGVEFNIYIGQSLSPNHRFDELYLKNMKMWQLMVLAKSARITHKLEKELSVPLQTTQLILAHSTPINISFRPDERKFDVDGAYNIRYEIIKKRIDKVHIKTTNERLTQPGKIAIVYSQPKEAEEYKGYIEFLQNQQLLLPVIEEFDLEELQGILGLKALRVSVNMEVDHANKRQELSTITSSHLIGK